MLVQVPPGPHQTPSAWVDRPSPDHAFPLHTPMPHLQAITTCCPGSTPIAQPTIQWKANKYLLNECLFAQPFQQVKALSTLRLIIWLTSSHPVPNPVCASRLIKSQRMIEAGQDRLTKGRDMGRLMLLLLSHFGCVWLCATPQTAAHQAPSCLGFSRQEHWSRLPFPSPMYESKR